MAELVEGATGLKAAERIARHDLARLNYPSANWVPERIGPDGRRVLDVLKDGHPSLPLLLLLDELVFFLQTLTSIGGKRADRRQLVLEVLHAVSRICLAAGARVIVAGSLDLGDYLRGALGVKPGELPQLFASLVHFPLPPPTFTSRRLEMQVWKLHSILRSNAHPIIPG